METNDNVIEFHPSFGDIFVSNITGNVGIYLKNGEEFFSSNIYDIVSNNNKSNTYLSYIRAWYDKNEEIHKFNNVYPRQ